MKEKNGKWDGPNDLLTERIIGCAMEVHRQLGPGYLESVYEKALLIELRRNEMESQNQVPIAVCYRGEAVGEFMADIVVENQVIIELKACQLLHPRHEAQVVNYLTATGMETGLLLNFGADSLQFKRKSRIFRSSAQSPKSC